MKPFTFFPQPQLIFGAGSFAKLPALIAQHGTSALIVTGGISLERSGKLEQLQKGCADLGITLHTYKVAAEPSPAIIDEAVTLYRKKQIAAVVSIGGGSSLDAGKAISAMLTVEESVRDYLEGVGSKNHPGTKVPFIAVPTTAGTGSEATKNSVISEVGPEGFKRSLRHDNFMPDLALVDPELAATLPAGTTAQCSLDAIAQLVESYISTKASPVSDALASHALELALTSILPLCTERLDDIDLRARMSYAAFISGITLANAGLGICHGIAGPLGGLFHIPHGVVCANILPESIRFTVGKLFADANRHAVTIKKIAHMGRIVLPGKSGDERFFCDAFCDTLDSWVQRLGIAPLSRYGIRMDDADRIAAVSDAKNSPVAADGDDLISIIKRRIL